MQMRRPLLEGISTGSVRAAVRWESSRRTMTLYRCNFNVRFLPRTRISSVHGNAISSLMVAMVKCKFNRSPDNL